MCVCVCSERGSPEGEDGQRKLVTQHSGTEGESYSPRVGSKAFHLPILHLQRNSKWMIVVIPVIISIKPDWASDEGKLTLVSSVPVDLSLWSADCDPQGALQAATRSGPHSTRGMHRRRVCKAWKHLRSERQHSCLQMGWNLCFPASSEASLPRGVWAGVRDADGRVRPPLFVEKKRTEEEGLAFLTGSGLSAPPNPLWDTWWRWKTGCDVRHHHTRRALAYLTNQVWGCVWPCRPCGSELALLNPLLWLTLTDALTLIWPVLHL